MKTKIRGGGRERYDYQFLIPLLKKRAMSWTEIDNLFKSRGQIIDRNSLIDRLTNNELLYEVNQGVYKILTKKDLDEYENRLRQRRQIKNGSK